MRSLVLMLVLVACGNSKSTASECAIGSTSCNGDCVDIASDPTNCGGCANACTGTAALCESGACVASCSPGLMACAGGCVNTTSDPANCGACGNACPADAALCEAGRCVSTSACASAPVAPGGACPSECTGGCQDNQCTIDCVGTAKCDGADIVCPAGFDCVVVCNGVDACDSGSITCPPGFGCTVICGGGNDACGDQQIMCGAGPCRVDCGPDGCSGANVMCGSGPCTASCGTPAPTVTCGGACACADC